MFKKDAKYHYGIKKHICGTAYANDFFVVNENMKTLSFIYKASANYMCSVLQQNDVNSKLIRLYSVSVIISFLFEILYYI